MAEVDATRACVVCGTLFARNGKVSLCSDECRAARQLAHHRACNLRHGRTKGPQQLTCAHCLGSFTGVASKVYCSRKCKDAARVLSGAQAASNARHRAANANRINERQRQYKAKARAEGRRPDRASEYANKKSRALGAIHAAMLWLDAGYYAAHAEALAMNSSIDRDARAKARVSKRRPDSSAEEFRWKYRNDPLFRQAQIQRSKTNKLKRKKQQIHALTTREAQAVYAERSSCLYCGCRLAIGEKVLDHMDPLSKGGAHDASNLVVACKKCNTRKAAKEFVKWLPLIAEGRRKLVADWYARKHGAPPEQIGLGLLMAA